MSTKSQSLKQGIRINNVIKQKTLDQKRNHFVDNYRGFRWIVREFLNLAPDIEVLADVVNGEETISEIKAAKPNVGLYKNTKVVDHHMKSAQGSKTMNFSS